MAAEASLEPPVPMASSFAGFRFGDSFEGVRRTCRGHGYKVDDVDHQGGSEFIDVRCQGVPSPEPGIDGEYTYVGLCDGLVCEISIFSSGAGISAVYRSAVAALAVRYGPPTEASSRAPADDAALRRACKAGGNLDVSAAWRWWTPSSARADVSVLCTESPYLSVAMMNAAAIAHYLSGGASDGSAP